jgi:hypothetical protein
MEPRSALKLTGRRFRLSRLFRLVAAEQLTSAELKELAVEPGTELAAVLLPTVPFLSVKGICINTVGLLESFRNPNFLPQVPKEMGQDLLAQLVLDSVLEVEHEGGFVSGALAGESFLFDTGCESIDTCVSACLSRQALRYADALGISDPGMLSSRLYSFNRIPLSPSWIRRLEIPESIEFWLGLNRQQSSPAEFLSDWTAVPAPPDNPSWRFFCRDDHSASGPFKLYINVHADFLREAIRVALPVLSEAGFGSFKICGELAGLLRPDKFVAYAPSRDAIDSASPALLSRLRGMPAQVVPFTAAIDDDGLLSWGIDPPRSERLSTRQGKSWRRWLTDKLAVSLIAARGVRATNPVRFAMQRLTFDGVDVNSWAPNSLTWLKEARS